MDLQSLMDKGGFVPPDLVPKDVKWTHAGPDGEQVTDEFTVFIKHRSAATMDRAAKAFREAKHEGETLAARAMLVSMCVFFDQQGKNGIPYDKACLLKESLCEVLFAAADEIIGLGNPAKN